MDTKSGFVNAIRATEDPFAPLKIEQAYSSVETLGQMMAHIADKDKTWEMLTRLLQTFPEEMDHIAADPNFICALSNLLVNALGQYTRKLSGEI